MAWLIKPWNFFFNSEQFRNNVHGISKEFEIYIQNIEVKLNDQQKKSSDSYKSIKFNLKESKEVLSVANNLFSLSHYFSVCFCAD